MPKADFQVGDTISHVDIPEFQGRVVSIEAEKVYVMVTGGWKGRDIPTWPVPIPLEKVRRVS